MPELTNQPELRLDTPPTHCSLGVRPVTMTGLFVQLMRQHFANPQSIENDAFRSRAWSKLACESGISILDSSVWDPAGAGKQPEIVVKRNKYTPIKLGIGDLAGITTEGHKRYSVAMQGSHTLFATAKAGPEAEILGAEVYMFLLSMQQVIREKFSLLKFALVDVGEISILQEASNVYAVPITVAYAWEESWVLYEHAPILKRITLSSLIPGS